MRLWGGGAACGSRLAVVPGAAGAPSEFWGCFFGGGVRRCRDSRLRTAPCRRLSVFIGTGPGSIGISRDLSGSIGVPLGVDRGSVGICRGSVASVGSGGRSVPRFRPVPRGVGARVDRERCGAAHCAGNNAGRPTEAPPPPPFPFRFVCGAARRRGGGGGGSSCGGNGRYCPGHKGGAGGAEARRPTGGGGEGGTQRG